MGAKGAATMPQGSLNPKAADSSRPYSPYRKQDLTVVLPDDWQDWDPVMKVEYLSSVEEKDPASSLVLESRRHAIQTERVAVDIRSQLTN